LKKSLSIASLLASMVLLARCGGSSRTFDAPVGSGTDVAKKTVSMNNFVGLVTAFGQLGAPPGSFSVADNVDFPNSNLAEKRRGWGSIGATNVGVPAALALAEPINSPSGHILGNMAANTAAAAASSLYDYDAAAAITARGALTFDNTVATRMKSAIMGGNTYLTTTNGVVRVESNGSGWWAGVPAPALDVEVVGTSATGWLAVGSSVAYRAVAVMTDASGREIVSPPSQRVIVKNTLAGVCNPQMVFLAVYSANSNYSPAPGVVTRIDIYRSSASTTASPSDEMQLAFRATQTGDGGGFAYTDDTCPDEALGAYLYTNAISGGDTVQNGVSVGLAARNDPPPVSADLAVFSNRMWYAGLTVPQELTFSIIAVGTSGTALKNGDVITVAGRAETAGMSFVVDTSGSVSENIRNTAMSLAKAITMDGVSSGVVAEHVGNDSSPGTIGKIRVYSLSQPRAAFTAQLTTGASGPSFVPNISTALASKSEKWLNGLAYSKDSQPDAVPPVNYIRVGRGDIPIMRMIALRDALFVFAADGLWTVTGNDPSNFSLNRFDTTFTLLARDTAVVLDDAIYAWGSEGIARITTSGVQLIDAAIRDIVAQQRIAGVSTAWAVSDRIRKRILFFIPNHSSTACALGSVSNRALVYNAAGAMGATSYSAATLGRWGRYDWGAANAKTCAIALAASDPQQLIAGNADDGAGALTAGTETDGPGYTRAVGTHYGHGLARERFANAATDWTDVDNTGAAVPITSTLRWTNATPDPTLVAQWTEAAALFAPSDTVALMGAPSALTFGFRTEMTPSEQTVAWQRPAAPFINSQARVMVPREAARGSRMFFSLTHSVGSDGTTKEYFSVDGFGLWFELDGREVSR
jgi:hypothetical protein